MVGASSLMGFRISDRLTGRCRLLKTWLYILEMLMVEIYYQDNLLPEVFAKVARGIDDPVLAQAFEKMAGSVVFGSSLELKEVWRNYPVRSGSYFLKPSDAQILVELGDHLGSTGREDQREKIKRCQSLLQNNLNLAETEKDKKTTLFRYLGFAVGTVLVLFLI